MPNLTGNEPFQNNGLYMNFNLLDFWSWYASDLLNHAVRGAIAEFIVSKALGADSPKAGWGSYDISYKGKRIEVKSCAAIGGKTGKPSSRIVFNIKPQVCCKPEDVELGFCTESKLWKTSCRHSDLYVFCFFAESDPQKASPLCLEQWEFFILPTRVIDDTIGNRHTIRIPTILDCGGIRCTFDTLKQRIDAFIGSVGDDDE